MRGSALPRTQLFVDEPVGELRGLATLTDPDDVTAVIDLAVIGARGDGKTQFIVHAIRAMHAHAPALDGAEQVLNRDVLKLVLDPRATRPDATPPGVVPHFTFRMRSAGLFDRLSWLGAIRLACRATGVATALGVSAALLVLGAVVGGKLGFEPGVIVAASGALIAGVAALAARRRIARTGDVEVVFWDVAGEQVYSAAAADYYGLLAHLVEGRRRRAEALGRAYAFAPVLICNPVALGTADEGSPYERMRHLLPLFATLDPEAARALIAINRWAVVDPICARGALRDEVVSVASNGRGEAPAPPRAVSREQVRANCFDAEDGRDQDVRLTYLRYDTAIKTQVEVDHEAATITYAYDDGPGAFSGAAATRFLDWVIGLVRWPASRAEPVVAAAAAAMPAVPAVPMASQPPIAPQAGPALSAPLVPVVAPVQVSVPMSDSDVWARPQDLPEAQ
ncbi:MAG: hypothetical protein E6J90_24165 [Deltaproteobacteria bacterium]|nr:MAG: hypothetical protein E6J91_50585 [Deltaproteobacteria bacterium]TMQ16211.1 MAG: hypothetical protein E6J90_24165 [Deltaproteobacteria bacterium]